MSVYQLNTTLKQRAATVRNLTLLSQMPLSDEEYQSVLPEFDWCLATEGRINSWARETPFAYGRMLTELTARCFVPRVAVSAKGTGLWPNVREQMPGATNGASIGRGFEMCLRYLGRSYPALFIGDFPGWRYVGNLLTHAGIPVKAVGFLVDAFRPFIQSRVEIDNIGPFLIEARLQNQAGLNKYTIGMLSNTNAGVLLVRQFLRLCRYIADGGHPNGGTFSKHFVQAVRRALHNTAEPVFIPVEKERTPRFIFDEIEEFIGWVMPESDGHMGDTHFTVTTDKPKPALPRHLGRGLLGIEVSPRRTTLTQHIMFPGLKIAFEPTSIIFFQNATGELVPQAVWQKEGLLAGEYIVLVSRGLNIGAEQCFKPAQAITITDAELPLPVGWWRHYRGYRVYLGATHNLQVFTGDTGWLPLWVEHGEGVMSGRVTLVGCRPTYVHAYHPARPFDKIPIFGGKTLPDVVFWGEAWQHSVPEIQLFRWEGTGWRQVACEITLKDQYQGGSRVSLTWLDMRDADEVLRASLFRILFFDLSYAPLDLPDTFFMWTPSIVALCPAGLLEPGAAPKFALVMAGRWSAACVTGDVNVDLDDSVTLVRHQLPTGERKGRVTIINEQKPSSRFTVEWHSYGAPMATVVHSDEAPPMPTKRRLLPATSVTPEQYANLRALHVHWWPVLTASLLQDGRALLANVLFDRGGAAKVYTLDLTGSLQEQWIRQGEAALTLAVGDRQWPLLTVVDQKSKKRALKADIVDLNTLLWECEVFIGYGTDGQRLACRDKLMERLSTWRDQSVAARFMLQRLHAFT